MKKRTISGTILIIVFFGSMLISTKLFSCIMSITALYAYWEIINIKYSKYNKLGLIKFMGYIFVLLLSMNEVFFNISNKITLILPIIFLLIPIVTYNDKNKYNIEDAFYILSSIYLVGLVFNNISQLATLDITKCIYIFVISFMTDTYAYLGGMLIGKHPLTTISPKKTIEGSIIGSIMGSIIGAFFYYVFIGEFNLITIYLI